MNLLPQERPVLPAFFKSAAEAAGHTVWQLTADLTDKAAVTQLSLLADSDLNRNHVGFFVLRFR